jgi:hypothetical protein
MRVDTLVAQTHDFDIPDTFEDEAENEPKIDPKTGGIKGDDEPQQNDLTSNIDLPALIAKLPCDKYDAKEEEERKKMFNSFDGSGKGMLSLTDVDQGLHTRLGSSKMVDALAPAIVRAFHAARDARSSGKEAEYVTRGEEFRLLLVYLKRYFELLVAFDRLDQSDDRRLDRAEFKQGLSMLSNWGVLVLDPDKEFDLMVQFDEFAGWALRQGLDMDPTDNIAAEQELIQHHKTSAQVAASSVKDTKDRMKRMEQQARADRTLICPRALPHRYPAIVACEVGSHRQVAVIVRCKLSLICSKTPSGRKVEQRGFW